MKATDTIKQFITEHPTMIEDLRLAANLIERKNNIMANSLRRYADELREIDNIGGIEQVWNKPEKVG